MLSKVRLSLLCLALVASLGAIQPSAAQADATPRCPAVWSNSPFDWFGPLGSFNPVQVSGTSATDVWAAGYNYGPPVGPELGHMDGSHWAKVSVPVAGPGELTGLATVSPGDVWAGGYLGPDEVDRKAVLLHWDGSSVQRVADPISGSEADSSAIADVAASGAGNVWVVGEETDGGMAKPVAERWDGSAWTEHDPPVSAGSSAEIRAVSTTGQTDVWVVGTERGAGGVVHTMTQHWNGDAWRSVPTPERGGRPRERALTDVAEASRGDVWAVGLASGNNLLVDHWDGTAWTSQIPPTRLRDHRSPTVAAAGPNDVWISVNNTRLTLPYGHLPFLHWDGSTLAPTAVPSIPTHSFAVYLGPVGLAGPGEMWAGVGGRMCPTLVGDAGFSPLAASADPAARFKHKRRDQAIYPETMTYAVDAAAGSSHRVRDASGLELYDSGSLEPGGSFTFDLPGAGTYEVVDPTTGATGTVAAPVAISPRKGDIALGFAIGAGQEHRLPGGLHVQMELLQPGSAEFVPWPAGDNGAWYFSRSDSSFTIPGSYVFRARVLDPASGAASEWSPGTTVKMKCCHSQVREGGFYPGFSVSVSGSPFVWRVQDESEHTHAVRDASPLRLYHSAVLTNGQSYSHTFKGAGSYPVLDSVRGFTGRVLIRPQASTLFGSVGKPITITVATERPKVPWRQWQIQIRRPGEPEFHPWRTGTSAECLPQHAGQYLFRARLYDTRLGQGVAWSPALTVRVS